MVDIEEVDNDGKEVVKEELTLETELDDEDDDVVGGAEYVTVVELLELETAT